MSENLDAPLAGKNGEIDERRGADDAERNQDDIGDGPTDQALHASRPERSLTYRSRIVVPTIRINNIR